MKILTIAGSTLASVLVIIFVSFNFPTAYGEEFKNIKEAALKVEGMTCSMCPLTIKTALKRVDGIVSVDVSYSDKEAKVEYEDGKVTVDDIVKTIENAGNYKATPIHDSKAGK